MRAVLAVAACCLSVWAGKAAAREQPARVSVTFDAHGAVATYRLGAPATELKLRDGAEAIRRETWRPDDPGYRLVEGRVYREDGAPFTDLRLRILPDRREHDRIWPALRRVGAQGWAVYGPHLFVQGVDTRVSVAGGPGTARLPVGTSAEGYLFSGPQSYVRRVGEASVVAAPEVPAAVREALGTAVSGAATRFTERLGAPPVAPLFLLDYAPAPNNDALVLRGSASRTGVVVMTVRWSDARLGHLLEPLADTAEHEVFHLWNGVLAQDGAVWLHEGGAEYAVAALKSEAERRTALERAFSTCVPALDRASLTALRSGRAPYACGMLAAWAADLEARAAGESVWAVWRELIAGNDASPSAAFLARPEFAGSDALKALASEGPTPDRWSRFASALKGADVRLGPDTPQTRHLLVTTLVGNACGRRGGYGYYNEPAALLLGTLDGTMDCGVVKQGQRIDAVEGHGLFDEADAAAAWTAASVRCAAGEPVRLEFKGALVAETPCTKPLPAPPVAWRVLKTGLPDGA